MNKILRYVADLIFPNRCPFCDGFIEWDKYACDKCTEKLEHAEVCDGCAKTPCICKNVAYSEAYTVFWYEGEVKKGIFALKNGESRNPAVLFGEALSEKISASGSLYDVIVPVPMTKISRRKRGCNQSELIAAVISERTGIKIEKRAMLKLFDKVQHSSVSARERAENVRGMYAVGDASRISGKRVLLCDDVITTASTANECAKVLLAAGASYVGVAAAATTRLKKPLDIISEK